MDKVVTYNRLKKFIMLSEAWERRFGKASTHLKGTGRGILLARERLADGRLGNEMMDVIIGWMERELAI